MQINIRAIRVRDPDTELQYFLQRNHYSTFAPKFALISQRQTRELSSDFLDCHIQLFLNTALFQQIVFAFNPIWPSLLGHIQEPRGGAQCAPQYMKQYKNDNIKSKLQRYNGTKVQRQTSNLNYHCDYCQRMLIDQSLSGGKMTQKQMQHRFFLCQTMITFLMMP